MRDNLHLYHRLQQQLCQWLPNERVTRLRNLSLLVVGLYLQRSVHLSHIVRGWPVPGKAASLANRLHRFLANPLLRPRHCYEPLAALLLRTVAGRQLTLVIDTTKVGFDHRALLVGLAYRKRVLPLAWSVHRGTRGNVAVTAQLALLRTVYELLPFDCEVTLLGDSGFKSADLLTWLRQQEWHFVIRQPGATKVQLPAGPPWAYLRTWALQPGETKTVGWVWLARTNPVGPVWLVLHWGVGQEEPWYLVSDQPGTAAVVTAYRRRMWIEATYGDMKGHGFDLERTHLRHAARLERLLLGVCLAYSWLISLGSWVVKNSHRHLIDRKTRRDKSYFRLGWDWVARSLRLGRPVRLRFVPYF